MLLFLLLLPVVRRSRYFTLLAPYPPEMIVGIAKSHAQHAADKVQQVQLPPSWNTRPVVAQPLHIGFVSGDFRGHVTAHLLQVMLFRVCTRALSRINSFTVCTRIGIVCYCIYSIVYRTLCYISTQSPPEQTAFKHFNPKRIRVSCFALTPSDNSKFRKAIEFSVAAGDFHDV